jgi:DNA-binding CsgD family transcriptional regulator
MSCNHQAQSCCLRRYWDRRSLMVDLPFVPSEYGSFEVGENPTAPTARDVEVFLAVVELPSLEVAAETLGISRTTVVHHLEILYARIGAKTRAHAAWLLYPLLGDRYVLPGDRALRRVA